MLRKALNRIFSSRVFYIIFSLLASVALWMYVEITEYQEQLWTVPGVEVVFRNEEVLRDRGLLISSFSPQTVTLSFETSRSVASRLKPPGAVFAEVDLTGVRSTGTAYVRFETIFPAGIDRNAVRETRFVDQVQLQVDKLSERSIDVHVDYKGGTASENLIAEPAEFSPQVITVSGPENVVSKIKQAYVPITRENLSSTISADLEFLLMDEFGVLIDENLLASVVTSHETIQVTIPIREVKSVPLTVDFMHGAGSTDQNTSVVIDPPMITVSGDPDALKDFNHITLGTIDTTRFGRTSTVPFAIIVPNYLKNLSGETEAFAVAEVIGLEIAYHSTANLQWINAPPDLSVVIQTQTLDVRIRGRAEDLALVSPENIRVVADLSGYGSGISMVPARVYVDGVDADVGAVGVDYRVTVRLS